MIHVCNTHSACSVPAGLYSAQYTVWYAQWCTLCVGQLTQFRDRGFPLRRRCQAVCTLLRSAADERGALPFEQFECLSLSEKREKTRAAEYTLLIQLFNYSKRSARIVGRNSTRSEKLTEHRKLNDTQWVRLSGG